MICSRVSSFKEHNAGWARYGADAPRQRDRYFQDEFGARTSSRKFHRGDSSCRKGIREDAVRTTRALSPR